MQTYIVVAAFATFHSFYQVSADIEHNTYSIHLGYEVTNVYEELIVSSISRCAVSCNISTECITATFDSQTRQCKLSDLDLGVANNTGNMVMKSVFPAKVLNVALKKPASMSSLSVDRVASRAVDGNTNQNFFDGNSCFHTLGEANPWWRVDLGNDYYISNAVLYNRMDYDNVLNIALKKPAFLSSVSLDRVASRAVDGDTNQDFFGSSCFHSLDETNPWWRVNLGIIYLLDYAVLYNRMDNNQYVRAHDILTKVGIELSSMYTIQYLPGTLPSIHVVQMPDPTEARLLEVSIQSLTNSALEKFHLCEIEVFGYPGCSKLL
ncbi:hypothetical protein ACF0H5_017213 [Mactra antiquata]